MHIFSAISGAVSLLVGWLVAIRLFKLARRSGASPERMLAIGFGGMFCVGYPLCAASRAPGLGETYQGSLLFVLGMLGIATGLCAFARFPQLVFRPGKPWAIALSGAIMLLGVVGCAGAATVVTFAADRNESIVSIQIWALTLLASTALSMGWNAIESGRYYGKMSRRRALGLADAETTHRFLLWALASGFAVFQIAVIAGIRATGLPILASMPMAIIAASSLTTSACWWLAFFMPPSYRALLALDVSEKSAT